MLQMKDLRMSMNLSLLITRPREFFSELSHCEPSLKWPGLIITIIAICSGIMGYQMGELTGRLFSHMMEGMGTITAVFGAGGAFVSTFLMWIIAAVIFFIIQRLLKGTGSFTLVTEITGYGMFPMIISAIAGILLAMHYLPLADVTPVIGSDPEKINAAVQSLMTDPALHQLTLISAILGIILMIWSANIWAFGLETCCGLDSRKALIAVGIPVLIYIIYTLVTLFVYTPGGI